MDGDVECMGEMRSEYSILGGKPEEKRTLGRPRRGWEYSIRLDLEEIGCEDVDWIHLAKDRDHWRDLVNTVMKPGSIKTGNFLTS
jgi:hypothetical protein